MTTYLVSYNLRMSEIGEDQHPGRIISSVSIKSTLSIDNVSISVIVIAIISVLCIDDMYYTYIRVAPSSR